MMMPLAGTAHLPYSDFPLDVRGLVGDCAKRHPNAMAILAPGLAPLNYGDLDVFVGYVTGALRSWGIGHNDRVAIVLPNGPEMATAFLSVGSWATCAPLNPAYGREEFDFYLSDLNAKALIVQADTNSAAEQVARGRGMAVITLAPNSEAKAGIFTLSEGPVSVSDEGGASGPDNVALVLHTSGTTSRPKIVPLTGANICCSAHHIRTALDLKPGDRCLNVMPLFHIHGLIGALLSSMAAGASVVCTPGFDVDGFWTWLETFHPTWYTAVPTMHQAILGQAEVHRDVIERYPLRLIRSCSASLPVQVMMQLEEIFQTPVIESYGMTEASHQMASNPLPPEARKPGSVGKAAGPEVAIMDEAGTLLPAGERGEIVIRGPNVTGGYENNPEANRSAFTEGWFRTGDQGYFDADGYLFLTGRIKEIINRGGEKIAPREVDETIMEHQAVAQAVTFAVPHPTLGEDMAVAVVLRKEAVAGEQEIREFALSRLAHFKVPSQVIIVDDIPKGPTGKLQRIGLAEKLSEHLTGAYAEPRSDTEKRLAAIWAEVLGRKEIGLHDNFFRIGGNSLLAAQVIARARAAFQVELTVATIFKDPSLAGQAAHITELVMKEIEEMSEEEAQRLCRESPA